MICLNSVCAGAIRDCNRYHRSDPILRTIRVTAVNFCFLPSLLLFSACSTSTPRVLEVTSEKRTRSVEYQDKRQLFLQDRASRLHFEAEPLPVNKLRQEFYVHWTGDGVSLVKFEYRLMNRPNTILVQTYPPHAESAHLFIVAGDEFLTGGQVSAWRISLCADSTGTVVMADKKSALW